MIHQNVSEIIRNEHRQFIQTLIDYKKYNIAHQCSCKYLFLDTYSGLQSLSVSMLLCSVSVLFKEQGITVLVSLCTYLHKVINCHIMVKGPD